MLAKENNNWWNAKSLAVQFIVWLVIINGMVALVVFLVPSLTQNVAQQVAGPSGFGMTPAQIANLGVNMFFGISGIAMLLGVIIIGHDSIVKERESGTAAWLLSKPLSRRSFILSKLVANNLNMLVIIVLVQGVIAYVLCSIALHGLMNITTFLAGLVLLGLDLTFFMVLSISLGAFTLSKGVTLGVPIMAALAGTIILPFEPNLGYFMPWGLAGTATSLVTGAPLDASAVYSVVATVVWVLLFALAAIIRFDSLEL
jgi:ABC-2 type transport system permease protein